MAEERWLYEANLSSSGRPVRRYRVQLIDDGGNWTIRKSDIGPGKIYSWSRAEALLTRVLRAEAALKTAREAVSEAEKFVLRASAALLAETARLDKAEGEGAS